MPKRYPPEFRRKVLDLVAAGRRVAQVAADLDITEQTIYVRHRQRLIDTGQLPGITSTDHAELVAARRRIAELEADVEIHRRAAELLKEVVAPKDALRGDRGDGLAPSSCPTGLPGTRRRRVRLLRMARALALGSRSASCVANRRHPEGSRRLRLRVHPTPHTIRGTKCAWSAGIAARNLNAFAAPVLLAEPLMASSTALDALSDVRGERMALG